MMDFLFQIGFSNACFAAALALVALMVGAKSRRPQLAHMLWLFVLIKLITPPLVNVPAPALFSSETPAADRPSAAEQGLVFPASATDNDSADGKAGVPSETASATPSAFRATIVAAWEQAHPWLAAIWISGSLLVIGGSLIRVYRFHCLLKVNKQAASSKVQHVATKLARRLRLKSLPEICTTSARISPMVWWVGGKVHVVIPQKLLHEMNSQQWQWVLAHELAHVRRRDYLVRWLEWLACVCVWWNPLVWWAQRNLRATEEICCDALVMSSLAPSSHTYAESILTAVESLVRPVVRPPAIASEINSGGFLKRRVEMILSGSAHQTSSRSLQFCMFALATFIIPLGIVHAQDFDAVSKRLTKSVQKGEITLEQAAVMMKALKETAQAEQGKRRWQEKTPKNDNDRELRFHKAAAEVKKMVKAGKINKKEAAEKIKALKIKIWKEKPSQQKDDREIRFYKAAAEIKELAATGIISKKEAGEKIKALKQRLWKEKTPRKESDREIQLHKAAAEIKKLAEAGYISEKEAAQKMKALKKKLGGKTSPKKSNDREARFYDAAAEIKEMVKAGKITREQADKKIDALKKKLWHERKDKERRDPKSRKQTLR